MKPYYERGGITIYHGDAREILPIIAPQSIDLLATDPPYGAGYVSSFRSVRTDVARPIHGDEDLSALSAILALCVPLLAPDRHVYYFASADETIGAACACLPSEWEFRRLLCWDKGNWGMGDLECDYGQQWEAIIFATNGRHPLNPPRPSSLLRPFGRGAGSTWDHPTQKPVALMKYLIEKSTAPSHVILDPFMGSGTTLRAAKDLGRRAIGIEIEERYCEIAAKRLQQEVLL